MKQTIIGIIIAVIAVIFAIQNSVDVQIKFLKWNWNCSLALLIIILLAAGIATGMLILAPTIYRKNSAISSSKKKIADLEKQLSTNANQKYK